MIKIFLTGLTFISLLSCDQYKDKINSADDYLIIPKPVSLEVKKGVFPINSSTTISADESLSNEANYLMNLIAKSTKDVITPKQVNDGTIALKIDSTINNLEGYHLNVIYNKIEISGGSSKGVFYGILSLKQLIQTDSSGKVTIPSVYIKDAPRFTYRGAHLDVARHFFSVDEVKKYLDIMAIHKMNTFHWHLTEDQGWRIEIKKYPKLTEVGGFRNGTIIGHYPGTANDQKTYGGFYTQSEVKEIIAYADKLHITVIPEIELPGHSSAAIASYPYLSCFPDKPTEVDNDMMSEKSKELQKNGTKKLVQETWGIFKDVFVPSEKTFSFLEDVLSEVIELFPSKYIHIGGDECPKDYWKKSKFCQDLIKKLKLKDEHELQSYFIQRIEKFINKKGKQIIGWDEILEGGLAPNATVMSWRGEKGGIEAAKQHHNVIMTPGTHCYFDHYQAKPTEEEPLAIGGYLPLEKVYSYEPIPSELSDEESKYVLGAQANLWTEYVPDNGQLEYMLLPRLTALSEVVWSKKSSRDFEDFKKRLASFIKNYEALGADYCKKSL